VVRFSWFLFLFCFFQLSLPAQPGSNSSTMDTALLSKLQARTIPPALTVTALYRKNLQLQFGGQINSVSNTVQSTLKPGLPRQREGKEYLFYLLTGIVLLFAFLKLLFPKYFNDLFRLFFRTTLKARQVREQMVQTPLPSLLLNIFFTLTAGLYITFLVRHYKIGESQNFWLLLAYTIAGLVVVYVVKYIGLLFSGWLFNMKEVAESYAFIVFIINKAVGIFLVPLLILLAFSEGSAYNITLTLSFAGLAALLAYRFILSYGVIRSQIRVAPFHFFLYLLAFEVIPLLVLYKWLMIFVG
jgi:Domain of unknown function (DUF4271)